MEIIMEWFYETNDKNLEKKLSIDNIFKSIICKY